MEIVLVAGLWLDGSAWDEVAAQLKRLGHQPVPVTLPVSAGTTLDDQLAAVLAAVDACAGRPWVVGHSAASALAWLAADARPDRVAGVALIGGFPSGDGEPYAPRFPLVDGGMPFPGWEPFEGPDSVDLSAEAKDRLAAAAIPVPEGVAQALVRLTDERRYDVPMVLICPEYTPDQVREWAAAGELPELVAARNVSYVDIDSGHWPMVTKPVELAEILAKAVAP